MTPKQILHAAFEATVTPRLARLGFRFVPSRFAYKRQVGELTQRIRISPSQRNTRYSMRFNSAFNVVSPAYNRWRARRGQEPKPNYIAGCVDWNVPGWDTGGELFFDFTRRLTRRRVVRGWLRLCLDVGIPYLDSLSSWPGAAADLVRQRWHWDRAADYLEIAGDPEGAIRALEAGIETLEGYDFSCPDGADPMLAEKRERQAAERDAEMEGFRRRIEKLGGSRASSR